jgi:hypothetical protein
MEFASVREWQARGALHLHVLIRLDYADASRLAVVRSGRRTSVPTVESLVRSVASHTDAGVVAQWGENIDCRPIRADESTGRAIWYLTKAIGYLVKDVADGGGPTSPAGLRHWARMTEAAHAYVCGSCRHLGRVCLIRACWPDLLLTCLVLRCSVMLVGLGSRR